MECQEVRDRLADHLRGDLSELVDAELRQHVASCASCRAEVDALDDVWTRLEEIPSEQMNSARMRARFMETLETNQHGMRSARLSSADRQGTVRAIWRQPLLQAGLAASLLIIGVLAGRFARTPVPPASSELADVRRELHDVREMLMLSLMQQQSATERLRGVSASSQIDQPGNEVVTALLDTLMHDPNVNVRLACVDALRRFSQQEVVRQGTVRALVNASSPLLQIALIDFMVETKEIEAVDTLRQLSEDSTLDEAVRDRAIWGVNQLKS